MVTGRTTPLQVVTLMRIAMRRHNRLHMPGGRTLRILDVQYHPPRPFALPSMPIKHSNQTTKVYAVNVFLQASVVLLAA